MRPEEVRPDCLRIKWIFSSNQLDFSMDVRTALMDYQAYQTLLSHHFFLQDLRHGFLQWRVQVAEQPPGVYFCTGVDELRVAEYQDPGGEEEERT